MSDNRIFREAVNGYGFSEVEQKPEGLYCYGCSTVHKRPTKMYQTDSAPKQLFCRDAVVRFWNPENFTSTL